MNTEILNILFVVVGVFGAIIVALAKVAFGKIDGIDRKISSNDSVVNTESVTKPLKQDTIKKFRAKAMSESELYDRENVRERPEY
jgi:hypothetical protein